MSKRSLLIIIGIWLIIFLFIGIPATFDKIFALITGIIVLIIGLKERPLVKLSKNKSNTYIEHRQSMTDVNVPENITHNSETSS